MPILFMFFFGRKMWMKGRGPFPMDNADQPAPSAATASSQPSGVSPSNPALDRLKMRLAEGEITTEEFENMKKAIE